MATTTRKSRAQRGADQAKAEQDAIKAAEAGEIEPTAEAVEQAAADQAKDQPEPEPELPPAQVDLGAYSYTMHRPKVTGPDGVTHSCPHKWGHTEERDAWACARKVGRQAGLQVEQPE